MTTTEIGAAPAAPPPPAPRPTPADAPVETVSRFDLWSDPVVVLVAGAVLAFAALPPTPLRALVTLPLTLVLPGHAALAALGRPDRSLAAGGRLAARVALSLAVVALVVLAVGWLAGVDRVPVVAGVWATVSACGLAAWSRPLPHRDAPRRSPFTQSGVLLGLAASVAVVVVAVALVVLPDPREAPYSRLSLTGSSLEGVTPLVVEEGEPALRVEVENATDEVVGYRVIPTVDGGRAWRAPRAVLSPGETWSGTIRGPVPADACVTRLRVALSADGEDAGVAPLVVYVRNETGDACG